MINANINKCQYQNLSLEARTEYAWIHGSLLNSRQGNQISFYLYKVADFFVEMIFDGNRKKILNVYAFDEEQTLSKYIETVCLDQLFCDQ